MPRRYDRVKAKPPAAVRRAALTRPTRRDRLPGCDEGEAFARIARRRHDFSDDLAGRWRDLISFFS
jgi:hypothetical protein